MADEEKTCRLCRFFNTTAPAEDRDRLPASYAAECIANPPAPVSRNDLGVFPMVLGSWRCGKWMALPKPKPEPRAQGDLIR